MSVPISAVPGVSNGGQAAPVAVEKPLTEFAAQMQDGGMSNMAHVANPSALASELVGNLRTYFDHAQRFEKLIEEVKNGGATDRVSAAPTNRVTAAPTSGLPTSGLPTSEVAFKHGGPAREHLEPLDSGGSRVSQEGGIDSTQLRRVMDVTLASMNFATETALVVKGTSQVSHSINTLLKGQ